MSGFGEDGGNDLTGQILQKMDVIIQLLNNMIQADVSHKFKAVDSGVPTHAPTVLATPPGLRSDGPILNQKPPTIGFSQELMIRNEDAEVVKFDVELKRRIRSEDEQDEKGCPLTFNNGSMGLGCVSVAGKEKHYAILFEYMFLDVVEVQALVRSKGLFYIEVVDDYESKLDDTDKPD